MKTKLFLVPFILIFGLTNAAIFNDNALPLIFAPDEICAGDDLNGCVWSPFLCISVTIKHGATILWCSDADQECDDPWACFSLRVPRGIAGVITIEAQDWRGNHNKKDVIIAP